MDRRAKEEKNVREGEFVFKDNINALRWNYLPCVKLQPQFLLINSYLQTGSISLVYSHVPISNHAWRQDRWKRAWVYFLKGYSTLAPRSGVDRLC